MKRLFLIGVCGLVFSISSLSQVMQASFGPGTTISRVKIYIKPTLAGGPVNGNISTFQFAVSIAAGITPVPTLTIIGTPAFGGGWVITPPYVEDGFRHYDIVSATAGNLVLGANVELEVMQLEFTGGPVTVNDVALYTLPGGGGSTGNGLFYCTGAANSMEGQLYYDRGGVTVVNNNSYTGALPSSATIGGILLPVKWLGFNAIKQGNNALLNWVVANEDANHHYELLRSSNGTDYTTIATVLKSTNGNTNYNYTDVGINSLGASTLYYRIKQVDIDGKTSYSDIRTLRLDKNEGLITIFPNPVTEGFYISIPFENRDNRMVQLKLVGTNGQLVASRQITTSQAANYYFDIKDKSIAAGNYYLQIIHEEKTMETKKIIIKR